MRPIDFGIMALSTFITIQFEPLETPVFATFYVFECFDNTKKASHRPSGKGIPAFRNKQQTPINQGKAYEISQS